MSSLKANLDENMLRRFLEMLPHRAVAEIASSLGFDPAKSSAKRQLAHHLEFYGGPIFNRIEQAFASASGHEALIKALDDRIAEYLDEGWSFDCGYLWAAPVNPSSQLDSAIEIRISRYSGANGTKPRAAVFNQESIGLRQCPSWGRPIGSGEKVGGV